MAALVSIAELLLWHWLSPNNYILFTPTMIIVSLLVGLYAGISATITGTVLVALLFFHPYDPAQLMTAKFISIVDEFKSLKPNEVISLTVFLSVGIAISFLSNAIKTRTQQLAEAATSAKLRTVVEKELIAAKDVAENAARMKSRFLDIAAHELRTPTAAFSLLLQLSQIQHERGNPPDLAIWLRLRAQADRLSRIVSDLLEVSRLDRGTLTLKCEATDLVSLLSDCLENFRLSAPTRRLTLSKPVQPVEIRMDRTRIYQVFSNLIDNAIKYTPEDTPIEVTVESNPNTVRVSVTDHGPGIPERQQKLLFNPFSRGKNDRVEQSAGLGLGLSICRGITELHGGTIGVTSNPGTGSTFHFELPRTLLSRKAA